jgi:hypothetical protein
VNEHSDEEDAIKVRDGRRGANDEAPAETHDPVGYVVLYIYIYMATSSKSILL